MTAPGRVTGHLERRTGQRGAVWVAKWREADGRQVKRVLGPCHDGRGRPRDGTLTERTARDLLDAILVDARRGTVANLRRVGATATFADAAAEFLRFSEHERDVEPSTLADYRGVIDKYLLGEFGALPVDAIDADMVDAYKGRLLAEGRIGNRTIVRHLVVLHGIFKRARRVWKIPTNPAAADVVERPKVRYSGEFVTLTPDEVRLLAARAADPQDAVLYVTAAFTGLRQGELRALRWADIDVGLQRVHVRRSYAGGREKAPKSGRVRSAPMVDDVLAALDRLSRREHFAGPDDLVFCTPVGGHLLDATILRRFRTDLDRAGLPKIRFHDLRHVFATLAVRTLPLTTVQGYLGHAHISTTMRYVHHTPAQADVALLTRALAPELGPEMVPKQANLGTIPAN